MTEIKETHPKLSPAATEFIIHWGNLGGQWGVTRSVAQIHALLFISDRPLHAEEIAEMLGLARSKDRKSTRLNSKSLMRTSYAVLCMKKKNSILQIHIYYV